MAHYSLIKRIYPNKPYKFLNTRLLEVNEMCSSNTSNDNFLFTTNNNFDKYFIDYQNLNILPFEKNIIESYNCKYIDNFEILFFNFNNYPIKELNEYLILNESKLFLDNNILLKKTKPTFYSPVHIKDNNNILVLGKEYCDTIIMNGFRIPYDRAIYIPPQTYYNDFFIRGAWKVIS